MQDAEIWMYYRATHSESIDQRHAEFTANMSLIGRPLGFSGIGLPPAPDCGAELVAIYDVKYPTPGLWLQGSYLYRGQGYRYQDRRSYDDKVQIGFKAANKALDYRQVLSNGLPQLITAFRAYRAMTTLGLHALHYCRRNPLYNRLLADQTIDVDGRNNIFTLEPAQYWDAEVCSRALGYGPDEVVRRLQGHALQANRLMDGVYLVLNDDPNLTYEDFVAMNERCKAMLGLI
jgi:hypothetical protein